MDGLTCVRGGHPDGSPPPATASLFVRGVHSACAVRHPHCGVGPTARAETGQIGRPKDPRQIRKFQEVTAAGAI